jgi:predicted nucleotidyltransferase
MLNKKLKEAIKLICARLRGKKIKWVLVGSVSLALQGVKIKPKDIDILTDKKGAFQIEKLFEKHKIQVFPVKLSHSKLFKSYFGKFKLNDVKFEVMGDLKEKTGNKWVSFSARLKSPKTVKFEGMKIPVSSLQEQLRSYSKLGRKKDIIRVKKIKEALKE